MTADFVALPKAELHRHLEGSVRPQTLLELAREVKLDLPRAEILRRASMRGEKSGFERFLSKFAIYRGLYPSREWIERVAFEAAEDARLDGVTYLELRFSPAHFARRTKARGEDVASWIAAAARKGGVEIRFIATFGRDFSLRENEPTVRALEGTNLFSGLDLAGNEKCPAEPFRKLFRKLDLPATIHAGEAGGPENVREAIELFGARRIGHGVRALEDPAVLALARARGVHFELCLTSEIQTGAAPSWRGHPGLRLAREGLSVSLNTDDPSICGVRLSDEYRRARRFDWTPEELARAAVAAAEAAFLPAPDRRRLARRLSAAWEGVRV